MDYAVSIGSILIGGGLLGFIQYLISRHDGRNEKDKAIIDRIDTLTEKVDKVESSLDERDAVLARTHILRFSDELYNNVKHSKEYFEQTLDDVATYEKYCCKNESFANGRTKAAADYIRSEYDRLMKEHKL